MVYRYDPASPLRPVAPQVTVFTTFPEFPEPDRDFDRWSSGIEFNGQECVTTYSFPYCGTTADTVVDDQEGKTQRFAPFRVYASAACDSVLESEDPEFVSLVQQKLEASISWQIARQLWTGSIDATQPFLQDVAQEAATGSGISDIEAVIGVLIQRYADTAKQGGWILHAPPLLIGKMLNANLVELVNGQYIGPYGQPVAALQGYPAMAVSDDTSLTTWTASAYGPAYDDTGTANDEGGAVGVAPLGQSSVDQSWMFISGRVEWAMRPFRAQPDSFRGRTQQNRTNRYVVYADTDAIVRFDPCAVFAQLVYDAG